MMTPSSAQAAEAVTVHTVTELQDAVSGATADTQITLGTDFPQDLPAAITLTQSTGFAIDIDGAGLSLNPPATTRHMVVNASAGTLTIRNLTLTQSVASATNKGIQLNQTGAAAVTLSDIDFRGLKSGTAFGGTPALSAGGNGTGPLMVKNSSFVGSEATFGSGMRVSRSSASQQTTLQNVTFDSNIGLAGSGYSGGAMFIEAGSQGTVTVNDSAFVNNALTNGGTYAHGGAIAMHNSNVQLQINRSYFSGNSVTSSTVANADGGALSAFNSTAGTNGSMFVTDSTFINNTAGDDGSAIFIEGRSAAQTDEFRTKLVVSNSTFVGNVAQNAGGTDSGGAIQASLRASVTVDHTTFVRDTTGGSVGGIDVGGHPGFDATNGIQTPKGQITNSIVTRNRSIDTNYFSCEGNVGCTANASTVAQADEPRLLTEVFGTDSPIAAENRSTLRTGDSRVGKTTYPLTTVAIAPPFSPTAFTAYESASQASALGADQRGVSFRPAPAQADAGSLAMEFVRFDAATNGGSWDGVASQFPASAGTYVENATASSGWFEVTDPASTVSLPSVEPTAPVGQRFVGWFTEAAGGTLIDASPLAEGQTLFAQFAAITHTVTFDSAGGSAVDPITDVPDGDTVAQPSNPIREGFTFTAWTLNGAAYDFATPVTADLTLTATWTAAPTPVLHTVKFDSAGGSTVDPITDVPDGSPVTPPAAPTRDGFDFAGWTLDGAAYEFDFATPVTADLILIATWTADEVTPTPVPTTPAPTTPAPPVIDPSTPVHGGGMNLPTTGAQLPVALLLGIATALLAAGGMAFIGARRRRHHS